ncbi:transcriptional regulator, XRE family [Nakamurella multipartita DSM 44233]|uniref:Transcriptional regulator, XRE family n=2 Tax=Nakamurella TaxID=53460 RepID=C8X7R2_NAKMY|nr:transcriptional regulator, XRE family [Nakamurella multipartita DSM 44233]
MPQLSFTQQEELADLLRGRRHELGLSASEVARRADITPASVTRLENCTNPRPSVETLTAICAVLDIPVADMLALVNVMPDSQLPSFTPYLRTKYHRMPDEAVQEMSAYFERLAKKYRISDGPADGEDET